MNFTYMLYYYTAYVIFVQFSF